MASDVSSNAHELLGAKKSTEFHSILKHLDSTQQNSQGKALLSFSVEHGRSTQAGRFHEIVIISDILLKNLHNYWPHNASFIPTIITKMDLQLSDVSHIIDTYLSQVPASFKKILFVVLLRLSEVWVGEDQEECVESNSKTPKTMALHIERATSDHFLSAYKSIQTSFGNRADVVFAHVIPAGWHLMQKCLNIPTDNLTQEMSTENSSGYDVFDTNEKSEKVNLVRKFLWHCFQVNNFVINSQLSSILGLPSWNLFPWDEDFRGDHCSVSSLSSHAIDRDFTDKDLLSICSKICELTHTYQLDSSLEIAEFPPTSIPALESPISKLVVICDVKMKNLGDVWPSSFSLRPSIEVCGVLKPTELVDKLKNINSTEDRIAFLFIPSIRNLLSVEKIQSCANHEVLKYPCCKFKEDGSSWVKSTVIPRMGEFRRAVHETFPNSLVIFSCVHCIKFEIIFDNLLKKHIKDTGHDLKPTISLEFVELQNKNLAASVEDLNHAISTDIRDKSALNINAFDFLDVTDPQCVSNFMPDGMNLNSLGLAKLAVSTMNQLAFIDNAFFNNVLASNPSNTKQNSDDLTDDADDDCKIIDVKPNISWLAIEVPVVEGLTQTSESKFGLKPAGDVHSLNNACDPPAIACDEPSVSCAAAPFACEASMATCNLTGVCDGPFVAVDASQILSVESASNQHVPSLIADSYAVGNEIPSSLDHSISTTRNYHDRTNAEFSTGDMTEQSIENECIIKSLDDWYTDAGVPVFKKRVCHLEELDPLSSISGDRISNSRRGEQSNSHRRRYTSSSPEKSRGRRSHNEKPLLHRRRSRDTVSPYYRSHPKSNSNTTSYHKHTREGSREHKKHVSHRYHRVNESSSHHQRSRDNIRVHKKCCTKRKSQEHDLPCRCTDLRLLLNTSNQHQLQIRFRSGGRKQRDCDRKYREKLQFSERTARSRSRSSPMRVVNYYASPQHQRSPSLRPSGSNEKNIGFEDDAHSRSNKNSLTLNKHIREPSIECLEELWHEVPRTASRNELDRLEDISSTREELFEQPLSEHDPLENISSTGEEVFEQPLSEHDPLENISSTREELFEQPLSEHDPLENISSTGEEVFEQPLSEHDPLENISSTREELDGQPAILDATNKRSFDNFNIYSDSVRDPHSSREYLNRPESYALKDVRSVNSRSREYLRRTRSRSRKHLRHDRSRSRENLLRKHSQSEEYSLRDLDCRPRSQDLQDRRSPSRDVRFPRSQSRKDSRQLEFHDDFLLSRSRFREYSLSEKPAGERKERKETKVSGNSSGSRVALPGPSASEAPAIGWQDNLKVCSKAATEVLQILHKRRTKRYDADPSTHPEYQRERRLFIDSCAGLDSSSLDVDGFLIYWRRKLKQMLDDEWHNKKSICLAILAMILENCDPYNSAQATPRLFSYTDVDIESEDFRLRNRSIHHENFVIMEKLMSFSVTRDQCLDLLRDVKVNNDMLLDLLLKKRLVDEGSDAFYASHRDFCSVVSTLRLLSQLPDALGYLAFQAQNLLDQIISARADCLNLLSLFSYDDKVALKLAFEKLNDKELVPKSLIEEDRIQEARLKLSGLLFRLLDFSDSFFELCVNTDADASEFSEIVRLVYEHFDDSSLVANEDSVKVLGVAVALRSTMCRFNR